MACRPSLPQVADLLGANPGSVASITLEREIATVCPTTPGGPAAAAGAVHPDLALLAEILGRVPIAHAVFHTSCDTRVTLAFPAPAVHVDEV
jgi:hypothetical protein